MKVLSLQDFFLDELKDLYSAEKQLIKALPKMAKAATAPELRDAFKTHLEQTKVHAERLEAIIASLGKKPTGKKCAAMEGLVEEGKEILEMEFEEGVLDAALITAAQKVEHYEIASYGSARSHAKLLGDNAAVKLLQQTLDEESDTDKLLTKLADSVVNVQAAAGDGEE